MYTAGDDDECTGDMGEGNCSGHCACAGCIRDTVESLSGGDLQDLHCAMVVVINLMREAMAHSKVRARRGMSAALGHGLPPGAGSH